MNIFFRRVQVTVLFCAVLAAADSDTRTVQAEFDRCHAVMERLERTLRRYEDTVNRIIRIVKRPAHSADNRLRQEAASLENRLEYFRNRFERARGQTDKIRSDIKASGPTCPSCITSSVNMYCRNSETLQSSLDDYLVKSDDLLNRINSSPAGNGISEYAQRRDHIDSLYRSLGTCDLSSAAPLIKQTEVNLHRADSLLSTGNETEAGKALSIAETLAKKAAERCNGQ